MTREQIATLPTAEERRDAREAAYNFYDQVRKIKDKYAPALTQAMTIQAVRDAETEEEAMQWITRSNHRHNPTLNKETIKQKPYRRSRTPTIRRFHAYMYNISEHNYIFRRSKPCQPPITQQGNQPPHS